MKITIITVVLNNALEIEKTIQSVLNQKDVDIEYIVIDGGSNDGTVELIKKYEKYLVFWVSEKDSGISEAFNKGILKATGDYIGFLNSGDWYEPNILNSTIYINEEFDVIYGDVQYYKGLDKDYIFKANHLYLNKFMSINHPSTFVKTKVIKGLKGFNCKYKFAMDYDLFLRLYLNGSSFKYIDKIISNMTLDGLSDKNWIKSYKEVFEIRKENLNSHFLYFEFFFKLIKRFVSKTLENSPFEFMRKFYRKKFSKIKKILK